MCAASLVAPREKWRGRNARRHPCVQSPTHHAARRRRHLSPASQARRALLGIQSSSRDTERLPNPTASPGDMAAAASSAFHAIASSECELGLGHASCKNDGTSPSPVRYFFDAIWQKQPAIYRCKHGASPDDDGKTADPLRQAFAMNWDDVASMLHHCRQRHPSTSTSPPLFFQNGNPITDPDTMYASNPHAAYLDGCSIIINHADLHHAAIAGICDDLSKTFREIYHIRI